MTGKEAPWTSDPVLLKHKFTNAYRASDRISQYLIKKVIYSGDQTGQEVCFRILLFKFFNKIETWELLSREAGPLSYRTFSSRTYGAVLNQALDAKQRIYSAAYIMPSGGALCTTGRKHQMHLDLLERMMSERLPSRLERARSMREAFELLLSYPTIGDFLAYQFVIDLNYSEILNFAENDFVMPGPGARDGIRKCFSNLGGLSEAEIIQVVTDRQEAEFARLNIDFPSLWGRPLQLIDCQNLFCEVDKYARVYHPEFTGKKGRTRIKQNFQPNEEPIDYWYPPKWGLNYQIVQSRNRSADVLPV